MPRYRVTIDREACDGIFACLTRDARFAEDGDGLATFDTDGALVEDCTDRIVAEFEDENLGDAEGAAAACPPGAIDVEVLES